MARFSPFTGPDARHMACYGVNHSDSGVLGVCDDCGATVVKSHKASGHLVDPVPSIRGAGGYRFRCWQPPHSCDRKSVALHKVTVAKAIIAGDFPKGTEVRVFKGRKVPVGTVGVVKWDDPHGEWGPRVGLAVEGQEKLVYTAATNVELADPEVLAEAQATVAAWEAEQAAWQAQWDAHLAERAAARDEAAALFEKVRDGMEGMSDDEKRAAFDQYMKDVAVIDARATAAHKALEQMCEDAGLNPYSMGLR